jgi:hypothetical protein
MATMMLSDDQRLVPAMRASQPDPVEALGNE